MANTFGISAADLNALNSEKDSETLGKRYGGVYGLATALATDLKGGLCDAKSVDAHRQTFGANQYKRVPPKSFFSILLEGFKDPVILLLCAAATVRTYQNPLAGSLLMRLHSWHQWMLS
eukprot:GHUV01040882.1.p1 GENE.GHUV01040882.1~~GHUV01040882.1.p1  ORF type:complete len:119 (-),score=11.38 GHUV01040882.1:370-726(-)